MARVVNQVRTLRFLAGEMTQAELGEKIGLTRQTIAAIEQGKYSPSLEAAFRIAQVFGNRQAARGSVQLGGVNARGPRAPVRAAPGRSSPA